MNLGITNLRAECGHTVPRRCSICMDDRRQDIEQAMLSGASYRVVAQRFAVSRDAVVRHRRHLPAALARAQEVKEASHGNSLLAQLRDLTLEAQRLKAVAEEAGDYRAALAAVRELCRIVELVAKLSGELESHSETKILNVTLDAETAQRISRTFLARHQPTLEGLCPKKSLHKTTSYLHWRIWIWLATRYCNTLP